MPRDIAARRKPIEERAFHEWLALTLPAGRSGLLPLGDDAAALRAPRGSLAVLSVDSLVEGTHFLARSPAALVGAAAAAVSLSDLASKGAAPKALLLALVVPPGTPRRWLEDVVQGAERTARRFGMDLVGGDTKPGPVRTVVSSVLGWGRAGHLAPRSGARPGDVVAVTGYVGKGGMAASRLLGRKRPSASAIADMLDVTPRVEEGRQLARWAHAMMDTSDGVAESARLIAAASRVRIEVDEGRLPLAPALRRASGSAKERRARAFYGGDYELFLTLSPHDLAAARGAVRRAGGRLTEIGRVRAGTGAWLRGRSKTVPMPDAGWRPFARPRSLRFE